jgi:hypothetical protein
VPGGVFSGIVKLIYQGVCISRNPEARMTIQARTTHHIRLSSMHPLSPTLRSNLMDLEPIAITLIVCEVIRFRQESLCRPPMKDTSILGTRISPFFTNGEANRRAGLYRGGFCVGLRCGFERVAVKEGLGDITCPCTQCTDSANARRTPNALKLSNL